MARAIVATLLPVSLIAALYTLTYWQLVAFQVVK